MMSPKTSEVFMLHDEWRVRFEGVIATPTWMDKGAANTCLALLKSGKAVLTPERNVQYLRTVKSDLSLAEREHAHRAAGLRQVFGTLLTGQHCDPDEAVGNLAEFLHQQYRAAAKAIVRQYGRALTPLQHDHGWGDCYGKTKKYFLRRARWLLTDYPAYNGRIPKCSK